MTGEYPFAESDFEISEQACALTVRVLSALRSRLSVNICLRGHKELLDQGQIFLFNHFARFETVIPQYLIFEETGVYCRSVAASEFFKGNETVAKFLGSIGAVPNDLEGVLPFLAADVLRGRKIIVFPEGGIVKARRVIAATGALAGYRVLIIFGTDVVEAETIAGITEWVEAGGAVLLNGVGPVRTVEGDRAPYDALAGIAPESGMVETGPAQIDLRHDVFLQHLAATQHRVAHRAYTGLSGDAEILAASGDGNAVVWQCRHGDGTALVCAGAWGERRV